MKRVAALLFVFLLCALASSAFADALTGMVQALGVRAASLGAHDASVSLNLVNWHADRYTPRIWAERYAAEYGGIADSRPFVGVCADYTMRAYNDIKANARKYNNAGMNGNQFFIASADTSAEIELWETTTREGAATYRNGAYVAMHYNGVPSKSHGNRNILTHKDAAGGRAKNHAWIWIQRNDGVWLWVDPTWPDFYGYVVWGYINSGEEMLLKPDEKFCVEWRPYLDDLPDSPARGTAIQPARVAGSRQPSDLREPSSSSRSRSDAYNYGLSVGISKPIKDFISGNIVSGSYWDTYFGLSLALDNGNAWPTILMVQLDCYNLDKASFLASFGYGRQLTSVFGLYGGAGVGFSIAAESLADIFIKKDTLALKAFVGARFLAGQVILRADISYHVDTGKLSGGYRDAFGGLIVPAIFAGWLL